MIKYSMTTTILIADDDPHIRQVLSFALTKAGLAVREAEDGAAALAIIAAHRIDLIVLDINMPRMDGLETCRALRAAGNLPILFLSSRDEEIDRVLGIELGADDYVVKPFSPREVVARVIAILRRSSAPPPPVLPHPVIHHGGLTLDHEGWRAMWQGVEVALTTTEFQLLHTLAVYPSKVFSRDAITDRLHGPGFAITDRTIDSHIRNLRAKFARAGCETLIETRAGVGYKLGACMAAAG